jgi:hypothetical protein
MLLVDKSDGEPALVDHELHRALQSDNSCVPRN